METQNTSAGNATGLAPEEQRLSDLWDQHVRCEFEVRSADAAVATMVEDAYVNHVPVMTGGSGHEQLREFYGKHFIPHIPPDREVTPVSRTVGVDRVVDELVVRFTHTTEMEWFLPGVPPTGNASKCPWLSSSTSRTTSSPMSTFTGTRPRCLPR